MTVPAGHQGPITVLGMDPGFDAPGWGFVLGQQNHALNGDIERDFATTAARNASATTRADRPVVSITQR